MPTPAELRICKILRASAHDLNYTPIPGLEKSAKIFLPPASSRANL